MPRVPDEAYLQELKDLAMNAPYSSHPTKQVDVLEYYHQLVAEQEEKQEQSTSSQTLQSTTGPQ